MPDTFRKQYRQLTHDEKARIERIKEKAEALHAELNTIGENPVDGLAMHHASTRLKECVFWAVNAITG